MRVGCPLTTPLCRGGCELSGYDGWGGGQLDGIYQTRWEQHSVSLGTQLGVLRVCRQIPLENSPRGWARQVCWGKRPPPPRAHRRPGVPAPHPPQAGREGGQVGTRGLLAAALCGAHVRGGRQEGHPCPSTRLLEAPTAWRAGCGFGLSRLQGWSGPGTGWAVRLAGGRGAARSTHSPLCPRRWDPLRQPVQRLWLHVPEPGGRVQGFLRWKGPVLVRLLR